MAFAEPGETIVALADPFDRRWALRLRQQRWQFGADELQQVGAEAFQLSPLAGAPVVDGCDLVVHSLEAGLLQQRPRRGPAWASPWRLKWDTKAARKASMAGSGGDTRRLA